MAAVYGALYEMGTSHQWLVTANFALSVLLGLWMLRYRHLYLATRAESENYSDLIENLSEGIYRSSLDGRMISANPALVALNGYHTEAELLAGVKDIATEWYVDPNRRDEFRAILMRDGKVVDFISEIRRHKTRERIWVTESARLVYDKKTNQPLFYEGSVREITETVERLKLEELFRKLTTHVPGGLFQFIRYKGSRFEYPYISSGFRRIVEADEQTDLADPHAFISLVHADDRARFTETLRHSGTQMAPWDCEFRMRAPESGEKWLRVNATPEAIEGGVIWHGYLSDISIRKKHEMEISKLAFYDPLTALPNRRLFVERVGGTIDRCVEKGSHAALLFIDLDNFKTLNDTMGHDVGDEFLVQVAERLKASVRQNDTVARIGGDEFVVLLEEVGGEHAIATRNAIVSANKVLSTLRETFRLGMLSHKTSASVGVVVFDGEDTQVDELLKYADMAMYRAKASGRNSIALFAPESLAVESQRFRLVADLREAIENDRLDIGLRPQVNDFGHVVGAEAVLDWDHPEHGAVPAEDIILLSEQFGLAADLSKAMLEKAAGALARWRHEAMTAELRLAVNVSVQAINSAGFVSFLEELIARRDIAAGNLTLEMTEHVMATSQKEVARRMDELKRIGVRLSLDDFGSGYSSLAYLKTLPFDELKINGSFVNDIERTEGDRALVKTILVMARTLKLTAVAGNVETVQQEAFLRAFGCDAFQGPRYAGTLSAEAFESFVAERNPAPVIAFPGSQQPA